MVKYSPKTCLICFDIYKPTSPNQKLCSECKPTWYKVKQKIRDKKRANKLNKILYEKICPVCNSVFKTYYRHKKFCGKKECDNIRIKLKNRKTHLNRDKEYLRTKSKLHYLKNRKKYLLQKAIDYRKNNPNAKPYKYGRTYKLNYQHVKNYIESEGYVLLSSEYINNRTYLSLRCPNGHEWKTSFHNFKDGGNRCPTCYRLNNYVSRPELYLRNIFKRKLAPFDVVYNDRSIIYPQELDFVFNDYGLAVEVCGLYWHSNIIKPNKYYHYLKFVKALKNNIVLLTFFEDEILLKSNLILSIVKKYLGIVNVVDCDDIILEFDVMSFYKEHCLKPICNDYSNFNSLGLLYKNDLVAVASFDDYGNVLTYIEHYDYIVNNGLEVVLGKVIELFSRCSIKIDLRFNYRFLNILRKMCFKLISFNINEVFATNQKQICNNIDKSLTVYGCGELIYYKDENTIHK